MIYLDNAATTALRPEVIEKMTESLKNNFGNASSTHAPGRASRAIIEQCRKNIASYFKASASEIIFTSGGTEADNLALRSSVRDLGVKEIITTKAEHHAVLYTAQQLEKEYDIKVTYVDLKCDSCLDYDHLEMLLKTEGKKLVSLMHINNEVGTILDLERVSQLCTAHKALFHTDTVQSIGHYDLDLSNINIDFLAASAHKFHGPKGVGFCYIRKETGIKPLIFGGEQERGQRAGTECIHNIVGMDEALRMAYQNMEFEQAYVKDLKHHFITSLKSQIPEIQFNGACATTDKSTYTLVNIGLPISPEKAAMLQFQLDLKGIACSKGSACQSGSVEASHVLRAFQDEELLKKPTVRFSFSIYNTNEELDRVVAVLKDLCC